MSFVEIAETWSESFSKSGFECSGDLNSYGVELIGKKNLNSGSLEVHIRKRLENTRGSEFSLKPNMYSNIIDVQFNTNEHIGFKAGVWRNNFWNRMFFPFFKSQHMSISKDYLISASDPFELEKLTSFIEKLESIYQLKIESNDLKLRMIGIMTLRNKQSEFLAAIIDYSNSI